MVASTAASRCTASKATPIFSGFELIFLGTSSARATNFRNTSCVALRHDVGVWLFDCGEGTTRQFDTCKLKTGRINKIFITHLHGYHIYGIPGIVMKTSLLKERLEIYAPAGIKSLFGERMFKDRGIVLRQIHMRKSKWPVLPGDILPNSASTPRADFFDVYEDARIKVSAGHILHSIFCVGYVIEEKLSHAVDIDALQAAFPHIDRSRLGNLYGGKDAECDGVRIEHKRFAKPRSGRKIVILGDTCDASSLKTIVDSPDIVVHEATCEDNDLMAAIRNFHSTAGMAGAFANSVNAKNLILTHFSPRYFQSRQDDCKATDHLISQAKQTFPDGNVHAASDYACFSLRRKKDQTESCALEVKDMSVD